MPKFVTTCTGSRIGNGSIVQGLFVIPLLFMSCGHTFEIFTIVAEIDDDMDLVFPFCDKLSGMICTKFFGRDMVYTLRVKCQGNQGVIQFRNGSNETAQLRKNKAVGILELRSIGYFKVGYQKMVNMAESSKTFKMYHYQQIKCETKQK